MEEEFKKAIKEKRCPVCVYCDKPLTKISQTFYNSVEWNWDEKTKKYIKNDGFGDADKPYHEECEMESWDFVDNGKETDTLGLTY